jgi:hypothetical protein
MIIDMTQYISLEGFDALQSEILSALDQFQVLEDNKNKSYIIWQERTENLPLTSLVQNTKQWIIDEFKREMYDHVEKITFIIYDNNNTPWNELNVMDEFVYVRPNLDNDLVVAGTLVESRAAMWSLQDTVLETKTQGYAVLFEGIFTDAFRERLKNV